MKFRWNPRKSSNPLVNVYITNWKITIFNGKIHYFDWAIFNSYVTNYQRENPMKSENRMNSFPEPGQVPRPFQSLTALQPLGMPVWTAAWFQWFSMGKSMDFEWFVHGIFMGGKFLEFHEIYGRIFQISMKMYEILRDLMGSSWEIHWMKWRVLTGVFFYNIPLIN